MSRYRHSNIVPSTLQSHRRRPFDLIAEELGLTGAKLTIPYANDYEWRLQVFSNHNYRRDHFHHKLAGRLPRAAELLGNGQNALWWWSTEGGWYSNE